MQNKSRFIREGIFNLSVFVLGVVVIAESVRLGFGGLEQPGAGLFPFFAGLTICTAQLFVIIKSVFRKGKQTEFPANKGATKRLAALIAVLVGWIVVMPFLGYILVTFAAVFAFAKLLGLKGWGRPLLLSAGTSLGVYLLFDRLLYLDLPRGLLG